MEADRRTLTPILVPIHSPGNITSAAHHLHLWPDSTLREVCDLLWATRYTSAAAVNLSLIYPDRGGKPAVRRLGCIRRHQKKSEDEVTLSAAGFEPGDALEAAVQGALCISGSDNQEGCTTTIGGESSRTV